MLLIVVLILFSFSSFSSLQFQLDQNWEVQEKLFGSDYLLIEKGSSNSIFIKKMPSDLSSKDSLSYLTKIVKDKERSPVPWEQIKIMSTEIMQWYSLSNGLFMKVEHLKKKLPYTSLVGAQPLKSGHYFIFYSEETLKFKKKEKEVLRAIKSIKAI